MRWSCCLPPTRRAWSTVTEVFLAIILIPYGQELVAAVQDWLQVRREFVLIDEELDLLS